MIQRPFIRSGFEFSTDNLDAAVFRLKTPLRKAKAQIRKHTNPKNLANVSRAQYAQYYKFSFVRNPWARTWSWYRNVSRDDWMSQVYGLNGQISFGEFARRFVGKRHLKTQTYWLKNTSGKIDLDFIGRFERLEEDFDQVTAALGLADTSLPHVLKAKEKVDLEEVYDESTRRLVQEAYSEEIELFGYSFPFK
jgi:hypothetical protein